MALAKCLSSTTANSRPSRSIARRSHRLARPFGSMMRGRLGVNMALLMESISRPCTHRDIHGRRGPILYVPSFHPAPALPCRCETIAPRVPLAAPAPSNEWCRDRTEPRDASTPLSAIPCGVVSRAETGVTPCPTRLPASHLIANPIRLATVETRALFATSDCQPESPPSGGTTPVS